MVKFETLNELCLMITNDGGYDIFLPKKELLLQGNVMVQKILNLQRFFSALKKMQDVRFSDSLQEDLQAKIFLL